MARVLDLRRAIVPIPESGDRSIRPSCRRRKRAFRATRDADRSGFAHCFCVRRCGPAARHAYVPFTGATAIAASAGSTHTCAVVGGGVEVLGRQQRGPARRRHDHAGADADSGQRPDERRHRRRGRATCTPARRDQAAPSSAGEPTRNGQLGDGTQHAAPDARGRDAASRAASRRSRPAQAHTCALTTGGGVKCWGKQQLRTARRQHHHAAADAGQRDRPRERRRRHRCGPFHTCAVTSAGAVKCWGSTPTASSATTRSAQRLDAGRRDRPRERRDRGRRGQRHTCALVSGGVKCWGLNANGQLGDDSQTPAAHAGRRDRASRAASRRSRPGCRTPARAPRRAGVQCWGLNQHGELGDGTLVIAASDAGRRDRAWRAGVAAITAGNQHTCALVTRRRGESAGATTLRAQLGDNATAQRLTPAVGARTAVASRRRPAADCTPARSSAAARCKCWGANDNGQLGDNSITQRLTPVDVSRACAAASSRVATGATHSCALTIAGGVKCWGDNGNGQLGDNSTTQRLTPVDVSGLTSGVTRHRRRRQPHLRAHERGRRQVLGTEQHRPARRQHDDATARAGRRESGLTSGVIAIEAGAATRAR